VRAATTECIKLLRDRSEPAGVNDRNSDDPASHIAWVAETLESMPAAMAMSMSTTQRIEPAQLPAIRRLLASLAARYGLRARIENDDGYGTVSFVRLDRATGRASCRN
jgi:hypothetical protein